MDTKNLRQALLAKQDELQERIRSTRAAEQSDGSDEDSTGDSGHVHLVEASEIRAGLEGEALTELKQIDEALRRLDDGTYGVCSACGSRISEARLEALPYASECIRCASRND